MEGKYPGVKFEVTGPDGERIADAIVKCRRALDDLQKNSRELDDAIRNLNLHINQKDAD